MPIDQISDQILEHHTRLRRPVVGLLRPGLSTADFATKASSLPFALPRSVTSLYLWRDGTTEGKEPYQDMWFFPGYYLLSLDRAIEVYHGLMAVPGLCPSSCLPIFKGSGVDYIGIECQQQAAQDGSVFEYLEGDAEPQVVFSSLEALLSTIVRCFEVRVFYSTDDGGFEIDDDGFERVAADCDPSVDR